MHDLISRQAAIDAVRSYYDDYDDLGTSDKSIEERIEELPSVQPENEHTMEEFMFGQDMGNPEDGSL